MLLSLPAPWKYPLLPVSTPVSLIHCMVVSKSPLMAPRDCSIFILKNNSSNYYVPVCSSSDRRVTCGAHTIPHNGVIGQLLLQTVMQCKSSPMSVIWKAHAPQPNLVRRVLAFYAPNFFSEVAPSFQMNMNNSTRMSRSFAHSPIMPRSEKPSSRAHSTPEPTNPYPPLNR